MAWVADLSNSPADAWDLKVHQVVWLNDGDLVLKMRFSVTIYDFGMVLWGNGSSVGHKARQLLLLPPLD